MAGHIFVTSSENFELCKQKGICGDAEHTHERTNAELLARFETLQKGDFVFFYVTGIQGIYGLWKVSNKPFYDNTPIWISESQVYPYRTCIEPYIRDFPKPVDMSDIYDLMDKGKIWTFELGKFGRSKNHHTITTEESKEFVRLLLRNNPVFKPVKAIPNAHPYRNNPLPLKLETDHKGFLKYEGYLTAWFMRMFSNGALKDIFGEYSDCLCNVPTSFNKEMDIFLTHITKVDGLDILHKYSVMELKRDLANEDDLAQLIRYENWLIRKMAEGDSEMVQSVIVAFDFANEVIGYVSKRKSLEQKTVRLFKYSVNKKINDIEIKEI